MASKIPRKRARETIKHLLAVGAENLRVFGVRVVDEENTNKGNNIKVGARVRSPPNCRTLTHTRRWPHFFCTERCHSASPGWHRQIKCVHVRTRPRVRAKRVWRDGFLSPFRRRRRRRRRRASTRKYPVLALVSCKAFIEVRLYFGGGLFGRFAN